MDVHGAGAQRSDPKSGNPDAFPNGHGPQGDDIRIYNYVRCVTGGEAEEYTPPYVKIPGWKGGGAGTSESGRRRHNGMQKFGGGHSRNMQQSSARSNQEIRHGSGMMNRRDGQGPPEEAFIACDGKSRGEPCSVLTPQGTLPGVCVSRNAQLFCVPEGHGPGRDRGRGTGMAPPQ